MISIHVKLFAAARDIVGQSEQTLRFPDGATADDLLSSLIASHPQLQPWRPHLRVAVNMEYAPVDRRLSDGDEVAIIPPVSGG